MQRFLVKTAIALSGIGLVVGGTQVPADAAQGHHHVKAGFTRVVVAPAVVDLITSAGITPAPTGPATAYPYRDSLALNFPITGYDLSVLRIKHKGGVSLTAGDATIRLRKFNIDLLRLRVSGVVDGTVGDVGRVDLFSIDKSDRLDLGLVRLDLTDTAAGALNATFGVDAFSAGDTFGCATPKPFGR